MPLKIAKLLRKDDYLCPVSLLDFMFELGVLFAIYGFLWGIFELLFRIMTSGTQRSVGQVYILKGIKYLLLVDVTFLFCVDDSNAKLVVMERIVVAGLILLTYFVGKLQNSQNRMMFMQFMSRGVPKMQAPLFNIKAEVAVISLAMICFGLFWVYPQFALNPVSEWFRTSIVDIEDTPVFGFIFKVVGFFFLLSLLFRMGGAITFLLNGGNTSGQQPNNNKAEGDDFSDYEELD